MSLGHSMKKYRSSIFSFDTLQGVQSNTFVAICIALLLFIGLEGVCRLFVSDLTEGWDYWSQSAASKYITYHDLRGQGTPPVVLTVGDSSADYGFSPVTFDSLLGETSYSYNLATLGNFPLSFDKTINDLILAEGNETSMPAYLMILFTRGGFEYSAVPRQTEQSVLQSALVKKSRGEISVGYVSVISRIWRSRIAILDYIRYGKHPISSERGYYSRIDGSEENVEKPVAQRDLLLDPERIKVLERTLQLCNERNIQPILVHPPVHSYEKHRWTDATVYSEAVRSLSEQYGVPFWDYSEDASYDNYMNDIVHLNPNGARLFSVELARRFQIWLSIR